MLNKTKSISPYQFAAFRILFGTYLCIHFLQLIPYGAEQFSREGILPSAALNPTHGIFPNILAYADSPACITATLVLASLLSLSLALGCFRKTSCLLLWYIWACLFHRNNLINNPGLPYVGLMLLLCLCIPQGEPLRCFKGRKSTTSETWSYPAMVYWTAWILLAAGYTASGWYKCLSPSWQDGTAMVHMVNNPLARPGLVRDLFLAVPLPFHKVITWFTLGMETLFIFFSFHRISRGLGWTLLLGMHLGILLMVDFADLSMGMVMIHLFTFDPDWLPVKRDSNTKRIVFFDGVCLLCNRSVQILLKEDRNEVFHYAPLQGTTATSMLSDAQVHDLNSMVYATEQQDQNVKVYERSDAVLTILRDLGGFWRVLSWLRIVPRPLRNTIYNRIATHRYQWFGKEKEGCLWASPEERVRILD